MRTSAPSHRELVLVEDDANDEWMSLTGISRSGVPCNVTVRRDGAEALEHLLSGTGPRPSLIVLDFKLPKFTGKEILARLRTNEATRLIPVVIFSGTYWGPELMDCYRIGANSCVVKPDDPSEYINRLSDVTRYWLTVNQDSEALSNLGERRGAE
jgi:two-component system response regulator